MAKEMIVEDLSCWVLEIAPAPVIFPCKISSSPELETIEEDEAEDYED